MGAAPAATEAGGNTASTAPTGAGVTVSVVCSVGADTSAVEATGSTARTTGPSCTVGSSKTVAVDSIGSAAPAAVVCTAGAATAAAEATTSGWKVANP